MLTLNVLIFNVWTGKKVPKTLRNPIYCRILSQGKQRLEVGGLPVPPRAQGLEHRGWGLGLFPSVPLH